MAQFNPLMNALDDYVSSFLTKMGNKYSENNNAFVNSNFAAQWAVRGYTEYDSNDFVRQQTQSVAEYEEKIKLLEDMGIPYATTVINDQAVIELPTNLDQSKMTAYYTEVMYAEKQQEEQSSAQIQERDKTWAEQQQEEERKDIQTAETILKTSGLTGTVSGQSIFDMLNEQTNTNSGGYTPQKIESEQQHHTLSEHMRPEDSILSNMDEVGSFAFALSRVSNLYKEYGLKEDDVFHNKVDGSNLVNYNTSHHSGKTESALVFKGQVIIDGKIVGAPDTEWSAREIKKYEKQADEIMEMHERRDYESSKIANGAHIEKTTDEYGNKELHFFDNKGNELDPTNPAYRAQFNATLVRDSIIHDEGGQSYSTEMLRSHDPLKNFEITINRDISIMRVAVNPLLNVTGEDIETIRKVVTVGAAANGIEVPDCVKECLTKEIDGDFRYNVAEKEGISTIMAEYATVVGKDINKLEKQLAGMKQGTQEYKDLQMKINKLKAEQTGYVDIGKKFRLTESDKALKLSAQKTLDNLNKDLGKYGIRFKAGQYVSKKDFLEVNKAFLEKMKDNGINILKGNSITGYKIDFNKLKSLSPAKLKEIGISPSTVKFMESMHGASAVSGLTSLGSMLASGLFRLNKDSEDFAEIRRDFRLAKNIGKHSKNAVANARKYHQNRVKKKIQISKQNNTNYWKKVAKKHEKKSEKVTKKLSKAKEKKLEKATDKATAKFVKKSARYEKSFFNRADRFIGNIKKKAVEASSETLAGKAFLKLNRFVDVLKEKALGLLKPAAGTVFGWITTAGGFILGVIAVIAIIQAMLNAILKFGDWIHKPDDYTGTSAYCLYAYMDMLEDEWLDQVLSYESESTKMNAYDSREKLKYGIDYQGLQAYINQKFDNRVICKGIGNDLYINPFHKNDLVTVTATNKGINTKVSNEEAMTRVEDYDGKYDYSISSNPSMYAKKETGIKSLTNVCAESGHTKNAKDILCMTDVMYQFSLTEFFNDEGGEFYSILGKSPSQIDWHNRYNTIIGTIKWCWDAAVSVVKNVYNFFVGLFGGSPKYVEVPDWNIYVGGTVGYECIQGYVGTLWTASHQQCIALDVEYYDVGKRVIVNDNGNPIDITDKITQQQASHFGVCKEPVHNYFKLYYNGATYGDKKPHPYLTKEGRTWRYALDTGIYDVKISMDKMDDKSSACLWDNMQANASTLKKIEDHISSQKDDSCWTKQTPKFLREIKSNNVTNTTWYDKPEDAKKDVSNKLYSIYSKHTLETSKYEFTKLTTEQKDILKFASSASEKPSFAVTYWQAATQQVHDYYNYKYIFYTGLEEDTKKASESKENKIPSDLNSARNSWERGGSSDEKRTVHTYWNKKIALPSKKDGEFVKNDDDKYEIKVKETNGKVVNTFVATEIKESDITKKSYGDACVIEFKGDDDKLHRIYMYSSEKVDVKKTQYKYSGNCILEKRYRTDYDRNCKGHSFCYCGGHICYHSQGIVYSMTNEQLLMTGANPDEENRPISDNYDLEKHGVKILKGKHEGIDYTTYLSAVNKAGKVKNPVADPQGSYLGSKKGLEMWTRGSKNAEGWYDGMGTSSDTKDLWEKGKSGEYFNVSSEYQAASNKMQDIFDIDIGIEKASNVFPLRKADYQNFESWTADNMTMAGIKFSMDWYDLYEFDIPLELTDNKSWLSYGNKYKVEEGKETIDKDPSAFTDGKSKDGKRDGVNPKRRIAALDAKSGNKVQYRSEYGKDNQPKSGYTLTNGDIKKIVDALKKHYGSEMTEARYKMCELALSWCGRGHYNEYHTDHDFLAGCCHTKSIIEYKNGTTLEREYNCTASNSLGFVKFIYHRRGYDTAVWDTNHMTSYSGSSMHGNAVVNLPADVIYHKGAKDKNGKYDFSQVDVRGCGNYINDNISSTSREIGGKSSTVTAITQDLDENAVFYLGVIDETIKLESGRTLFKGDTLTIGLTQKNEIGNIWLNSKTMGNFFSISYDANPYWVTYPDKRTYYKRLY